MTKATALLTATVLAACAGVGGTRIAPDSPADVKARIAKEQTEAFWNAVIAGEYQKAYDFLTPGSKAAMPFSVFQSKVAGSGFRYRAVKMDTAECEAASCVVKFTLTYDFRDFRGVSTVAEETWVIDNGRMGLLRKE